jgi:predicted nucleotidyltransferase component of viral defense system
LVDGRTLVQIEQDLLLSRLICEIANDPYLGAELVFRGGTCFHKLRISPARRYSEDLDYVRVSAGGIQPLTSALTALGEALGFDVRTRISEQPKIFFRARAADGGQIRIKIEINTHERAPVEPLEGVQFAVDSPYWSGSATVQTFSTNELVATKIRALYQRRKGRDLFDLWLALSNLGLAGDQLVTTFSPYRPEGMTAGRAEENLRAKLADEGFRTDLEPLVGSWPSSYDIDEAGELLVTEVLRKL